MLHRNLMIVASIASLYVGYVYGGDAKSLIEREITVKGSPGEVFDLWLSESDVREFFAPDAHIEPYVGGRYEIIFEPETDPQGKQSGTFGAKLLYIKRGKRLDFQWRGPEWATEMNVRPFPTSVKVYFSVDQQNSNRTHVKLVHSGFGTGGDWDRAYDFFAKAKGWSNVLDRLQTYCEKIFSETGQKQSASNDVTPTLQFSDGRVLYKQTEVNASTQQL